MYEQTLPCNAFVRHASGPAFSVVQDDPQAVAGQDVLAPARVIDFHLVTTYTGGEEGRYLAEFQWTATGDDLDIGEGSGSTNGVHTKRNMSTVY